MSYTGGIDSHLRDTQDGIMSGARNPLDSRLLDVLALQRIKEAQEKAKTELLTSMEGKEGTVADQLTNEVINNEKEKLQGGIKDIAAQVGATNNQQAHQQQQNLQRVAQQGVATQPAPNMARMAGGGIVTFAKGDEVKGLSNRTPAQLLEEAGITEAQFARMSDRQKAELFKTINRNRSLARSVGTGAGALNTTLAGIYDAASMPVTALGKVLGTAGKATGIVDPQSPDPLQSYTPEGEHTWTPALDAVNRMAQRNQPITRQDLAPRDTKLAGSLGPDLAAVSDMVGAQPAAQPAAAANTIDPTSPPELTGIQTIPSDTGQTTATGNLGLPGDKRKDIAFERRPEMAGVINKQNELRDYTKGIRGLDVGAARKDQLAGADKHMNRAGIASQYKNMLARRQEADRVSGEERKYWALNDMLARAGGQGALSNIARGAADMRTAKREDILRRHDKRDELERAGIKTDESIAGRTLESGDRAAKLTSEEKKAATTAESNLLSNQASNLTEEAKAVLQGKMANLTAESRAFDRRLSLIMANDSNEVKVAVANLNGKLKSKANEIAKMAISAKSVSDFNVVLARINEAMGKIRAGVADDLTKVTTSSPIYMAMQQNEPKEAAKYLEAMQDRYQKIAKDAVRELTAQRKLVTARLAGVSGFKRPDQKE